MTFNITNEYLDDLVFVFGVETGLKEFLSIVEKEAAHYLANTNRKCSELERLYLLDKMGYDITDLKEKK